MARHEGLTAVPDGLGTCTHVSRRQVLQSALIGAVTDPLLTASTSTPRTPDLPRLRGRYQPSGPGWYSILLSPDGRWLLGNGLRDSLWLWDLSVDARAVRLAADGSLVGGVAMGNTSMMAAYTAVRAPTGDPRIRILHRGPPPVTTYLSGHTKLAFDVSFSRRDEFALSVGGDLVSRLWETSSGKELARSAALPTGQLRCLLDPDMRFSATWDLAGPLLRVCDGSQLRRAQYLCLQDQSLAIIDVANLPGRRIVACGGHLFERAPGEIALFDMMKRLRVASWTTDSMAVWCGMYHENTRLLYLCEDAGRPNLYSCEIGLTGLGQPRLLLAEPVMCAHIAPGCSFAVAATRRHLVLINQNQDVRLPLGGGRASHVGVGNGIAAVAFEAEDAIRIFDLTSRKLIHRLEPDQT